MQTNILLLLAACVATSMAIKIHNIHCISEIQARFAITDFTSRIESDTTWATQEEAIYEVYLPERAFISWFSIKMDGLITYGEVLEKDKARIEYEEAKRNGRAGGHIEQNMDALPKDTKKFTLKVTVPRGKQVEFNMTYQEMLERESGVYKHVINVNPKGTVDDVQVDVLIAEKSPFRLLSEPNPDTTIFVPRFGNDIAYKTNDQLLRLPAATDVEIRSTQANGGSLAYVFYKQGRVRRSGQICILFDIERDQQAGGTIQTYDGYFLQSIAPDNIPVGNKNVVFVIDKSGSMKGRKIAQVKKAMETILDDLDPTDNFAVILFSKTTQAWTDSLVPARPQNIQQAKNFINQSEAKGGTNIYDSISEALEMLKKHDQQNPRSNPLSSMVIFLTDGQPTVGKKDPNDILTSIITQNRESQWSQETKYAIHGIGFGNNAAMDLLQQIAAANNGVARRVFADSDADIQLEGVFSQFSSPLLRNVDIKYLNGDVDVGTLIQPNQQNDVINQGGEFVQVGKLSAAGRRKRAIGSPLTARVTGDGKNGAIKLEQKAFAEECYPTPDFTRPDGSAVPSKYIVTCDSTSVETPTPPPTRPTPTRQTALTPPPPTRAPATLPPPKAPQAPNNQGVGQLFGRIFGNTNGGSGSNPLESLLGDRFSQVFGGRFGGGRRKRQSSMNGDFGSKPDVDRPIGASNSIGGFIERTWAYLTIKKATKESKEWQRSQQERDAKQQQAIDLSKKYNFVSEFTSMLVIHGRQRTEAVQDEWGTDGETANDAIDDNTVDPGTQNPNAVPSDGECRQGVILVLDNRDTTNLRRRATDVRRLCDSIQATHSNKAEFTVYELSAGGQIQQRTDRVDNCALVVAALNAVANKAACDNCRQGFSALAPYLLGRSTSTIYKSVLTITDNASECGQFCEVLKGFAMPKLFVPVDNKPFAENKQAALEKVTQSSQVLHFFDSNEIVKAVDCDY